MGLNGHSAGAAGSGGSEHDGWRGLEGSTTLDSPVSRVRVEDRAAEGLQSAGGGAKARESSLGNALVWS